jgi:hypothetical protein
MGDLWALDVGLVCLLIACFETKASAGLETVGSGLMCLSSWDVKLETTISSGLLTMIFEVRSGTSANIQSSISDGASEVSIEDSFERDREW